MINLPVDFAHAFDYLTILEIKYVKNIIGRDKFAEVAGALAAQVGNNVFIRIINSPEYIALHAANSKTFDACNTEAFLAKEALQKKFFPDIEPKETKAHE